MIIYLDQNKWIDLARAYTGRKDGESYIEVMKYIKEKADKNEWILPISTTHFMETINIGNTERRKRFSSVLIEFSKMNTMCSSIKIEKYELFNSFLIILDKNKIDISNILFSNDIDNLLSLPAYKLKFKTENVEIKKFVENFLKKELSSPEFLNKIINMNFYEDLKNTDYDEWTLDAEKQEKLRQFYIHQIKQDSMRYKQIIYDGYIYLRTKYFDELLLVLTANGVKKNELDLISNYITNNSEKFLESIPSLHVRAKLSFQRYKDSKKMHRNDAKDIISISTALPYCDVVISENSWVDFIKREKLDEFYMTKVFTNLNDLLKL